MKTKEVNEYKYLGKLLTPGNNIDRVTDQRITAGCWCFVKYTAFLKKKNIVTRSIKCCGVYSGGQKFSDLLFLCG